MAQTTIKLTLQSGSGQTEKVFRQDSVLFGAVSSDLRDLPIDTSFLLPEHVKIFVKDGVFFAQNLANDPFVSVNERPFGKRKLNNGDRITIGELEVLFEGHTANSRPVRQAAKPLQNLGDSLDRKMRGISASRREPIVEDDEDLEALIREVESFEAEEALEAHSHDHASFNANALQGAVPEVEARVGRQTIQRQTAEAGNTKSMRPLKERHPTKPKHLSPLDDTMQAVKQQFVSLEVPRRSIWRPLLATLIVLMTVMVAIGSGIYFTFSERSDEQEYIAAQGLADMSMALTYAQLHQLRPPNQNWADPDFLKESLSSILPAAYPSLVAIDKQGIFTESPYMLRIYTNSDLSQFLLIAQPEPSLWQWLLSRETILLDSRTMELHKTTDLRALNRLLANSRPLDGANALEVSHLVSQASLMQLTSLSAETGHREFLPPKGLSKIVSGAENHIYNAPRYYRMSAPLVGALADYISNGESGNGDVPQELRDRVTSYFRLSNSVLYSELNDSTTGRVADLLRGWFPEQTPPIFAEVQLQRDDGRVLSTYLLGHKPSDSDVSVDDAGLQEESAVSDSGLAILQPLDEAVEKRRRVLIPFQRQLSQLIAKQIAAPSEDFPDLAMQMIRAFADIDAAEQIDIRQTIVDVYRSRVLEDGGFSHSDFIAETKRSAIAPFLPAEFFEAEPLETSRAQIVEGVREDNGHSVDLGEAMREVQQAADFTALEEAVSAANRVLAEEPFTTDEKLRASRNKVQVLVVHRLEQLILGPSSSLPESAFDLHNRNRIQYILRAAGIDDQEQLDYYLYEYDLLLHQKNK